MKVCAQEFHKGFSLIEMLVVIGIIGVLAGICAVGFGGATESARAAACLSNMRSLAQACNSVAMGGYYPLAGSRESIGADDSGSIGYNEQVGWISWLSQNKYGTTSEDTTGNEENSTSKPLPKSHQSNTIFPFYGDGDENNARFALHHGKLWKTLGGNREVYVCPEHKRQRLSNGLSAPYWSYVMNSKFGYDYSKGAKATATSEDYGVPLGSISSAAYKRKVGADRVLMFAELPLSTTKENSKDLYQADCTLQYSGTVNGTELKNQWTGEGEAIGFMHKVNKQKCAHVVFADCHTEKLVYGKRNSSTTDDTGTTESAGLTPEDLTAALCDGLDVTFDGKEYKVENFNESESE